jgi:DNA-binding transcriptional ArsR family regulator
MNNIRVVMVEGDVSDAVVQAVISRMTGERATGAAAAVVTETAARLLPGPEGTPPAKRRGKGKLKHPMGGHGAPPAEGSRAEDLAAAASLRGRILELLKKRAMTSKEVIDATGATAGTVYQQLSMLRKDRKVETREDPEQGRNKNYLAE